jgi:streptomycin 6-kinase
VRAWPDMAMERPLLKIPVNVRRNVVAWFGTDGEAWLDSIPETIGRLVDEWRLIIGSPLAGGTSSLVLTAAQRDGTPAVLKVPYVEDENRGEADALRHYGGVGAVQLYRHDPQSGALLLEKLLPGTGLETYPDADAAIDIACRLLRRLWQSPRCGHRFALVRDLAHGWAETFPAENDRHGCPFPARLAEEAAQLARQLEQAGGHDVVVNRDAHLANILAAEREPWLLIDPKPLVGDRAFDGAYLLLDRLGESPARSAVAPLLHKLAGGLGVERERLRGWAFLRAFENVLWALDVHESADAHLAKANALCE